MYRSVLQGVFLLWCVLVVEALDVRVLQSVAVCCSVLLLLRLRMSRVLQCAIMSCSESCAAVCCRVWQCVAVCCSVLQCVAVCCSVSLCANMSCSESLCVAIC